MKLTEIICSNCDKGFLAKKSDAIFCSNGCRQDNYLKRLYGRDSGSRRKKVDLGKATAYLMLWLNDFFFLVSHAKNEKGNLNKKALTLNEVVAYTGYSKSYILKLSCYGKILCFKPNGKALFFDKDEIDSWLLRNKKVSAAEIDIKAATHVTLNKK